MSTIDFFDPSALCAPGAAPLPGRIGMTGAPGLEGSDPALALAAIAALPATTLVSLLPDADLPVYRLRRLPELAQAAGLVLVQHGIEDYAAPESLEATIALVDAILARVERGETVVVHCGGGFGRTGTVAACCLVRLGWGAVDAVAAVRATRPGTIETAAQEAFVARFAEGVLGVPRSG